MRVLAVWMALTVAAVAQTPPPQTPQPQTTSPQTPSEQPAPTFRTRSEGVRVEVLVTDGERPVGGLAARDFELVDSGVRQQVNVETLADTPLDVILVLDTSTSLTAQGLSHLARAADALIARLQPRDRAGLVTFSQDVMIRSALTTQHERVRAGLRNLQLHGTTAVIDSTYAGMALSDGDRPTLLLVFTDGIDTASWLRPRDVLDTARRSGVVPYAVVVGEGVAFMPSFVQLTPRRALDQLRARADETERFLGDLVSTGGGVFMNAAQTRNLEERFADALDNFRQRYVLTYSPTGVERTGWHPIAIKIKEHASYRVRARQGYFVR